MFSQAAKLPPKVAFVTPETISQEIPQDTSNQKAEAQSAQPIAIPEPPETLPPQFSINRTPSFSFPQQITQKVVVENGKTGSVNSGSASSTNVQPTNTATGASNETLQPATVTNGTGASSTNVQPTTTATDTSNTSKDNPVVDAGLNNFLANSKSLLLGIIVNKKEVGSLEVLREEKVLLLPLSDFADLAGFTVETTNETTQLKTPLGVVKLAAGDLKKIAGITYISETVLQEKLAANIEFKTADLALIVDLPWRGDGGNRRRQAVNLQPEVRPSSTGLSNIRQELDFNDSSRNTTWRSATILGGRLAGGAWRLRLDNNFVNQPNLSEYYFFKRSGQFLYQIGRQQVGLHPLLSGVNFTGGQFAYTNLPTDKFNTNYSSASELLPRRSQPAQTFRGVVPPTSFVQLRVSGVVVAQQQVGFSGEYEFPDINLPSGRANEIELLVFDRNNLSVPKEVRSLRLNVSDLLLPSGGTVQLVGAGVTGNLIQDNVFDDFGNRDTGKFAGFYQARQGITNNFTVEGTVLVLPDTTQTEAGFAWRLADPVILATSVGTSRGQVGYTADLDVQLNRFQILGNSEFYPSGYLYSTQTRDRINHSLETKYQVNNNFDLGFIARQYKNENDSTEYIAPTFSLRPFSNLSLAGRPDVLGRYTLNAYYQPTSKTNLSFNSAGDIYTTNLRYNLSPEYIVSFGTEGGGNLPNRYTLTLDRSARSLSDLSWRLGVGYRDGEVGAIVGANMRLLPGLFARVDYQGIPSRTRNIFGGIGDESLTVSLVSDLSFSNGRVAPSEYSALNKERGGISGRVFAEGGKTGFDFRGSIIRVIDNQNRTVGGTETDAQGNFFVGNLREGVYLVEVDPEGLPIELSLKKTSVVAEVAAAAVTKLDFPVKIEYGLAGLITDATGKPIPYIEVEVINAEGKKVSSAATDEFGLYRLDGVPIGKYTLRIPPQDGITNSETFPTKEISIDNDFIYDQNLQLPFTPAVPENPAPAATPQ